MKWQRIGGFTFRCGRYVVQDHGYHWGAWFNRESLGKCKSEAEAKELCESHACPIEHHPHHKPLTLDQWIDRQPLTGDL